MVDLANTKYTHANLIRQMIRDARKGIPTIQEDKGKTEQPSATKYLDEIRGQGGRHVDRTKFIDDLIDAGASDDEIAEALSLAEERGVCDSTATA